MNNVPIFRIKDKVGKDRGFWINCAYWSVPVYEVDEPAEAWLYPNAWGEFIFDYEQHIEETP